MNEKTNETNERLHEYICDDVVELKTHPFGEREAEGREREREREREFVP
jgi:hypothetical protein